MKKTVNSLRSEVVFMLEKYQLLQEEITPSTTQEGITITFTRKNDPRKLQSLIHYLNAEKVNYYMYFCTITKRLKLSVFTE